MPEKVSSYWEPDNEVVSILDSRSLNIRLSQNKTIRLPSQFNFIYKVMNSKASLRSLQCSAVAWISKIQHYLVSILQNTKLQYNFNTGKQQLFVFKWSAINLRLNHGLHKKLQASSNWLPTQPKQTSPAFLFSPQSFWPPRQQRLFHPPSHNPLACNLSSCKVNFSTVSYNFRNS